MHIFFSVLINKIDWLVFKDNLLWFVFFVINNVRVVERSRCALCIWLERLQHVKRVRHATAATSRNRRTYINGRTQRRVDGSKKFTNRGAIVGTGSGLIGVHRGLLEQGRSTKKCF